MTVSTILALLLTAQAPNAAQAPAPAPAPADAARTAAVAQIQVAARAFSGCVQTKIPTVAPSLTPEQGADSILAACKTEQTAAEQAVGAMIASMPAESQAGARAQLSDGMARARTQLADRIRQSRTTTPATPPK